MLGEKEPELLKNTAAGLFTWLEKASNVSACERKGLVSVVLLASVKNMNPLNQERSKTQVLVGKVFQGSYLWRTIAVLNILVLVKEEVGRGSGWWLCFQQLFHHY